MAINQIMVIVYVVIIILGFGFIGFLLICLMREGKPGLVKGMIKDLKDLWHWKF